VISLRRIVGGSVTIYNSVQRMIALQKDTAMPVSTLDSQSQVDVEPTAPHPDQDQRFKLLEAAMKRHQYQPDALIEVLHSAQQLFGYLAPDLLLAIAHSLKLPPSRVYGVATFYHFFSLTPKGNHTCVVCMGTPCYVKGAPAVLAAIEQHTHIRAGQTTSDNLLSLEKVRCIGACGLAPLLILDGTVLGHQTEASALEHLKGWGEDGSR
jgi:bidirectional [NiFe] hydrogenase diaphorase subunit